MDFFANQKALANLGDDVQVFLASNVGKYLVRAAQNTEVAALREMAELLSQENEALRACGASGILHAGSALARVFCGLRIAVCLSTPCLTLRRRRRFNDCRC